ncbi:MAG: hypothetical protein IIC20_05765, partial [Chloroflexi bacterium]|nr:hypothetical protein [Chloroflexota bacterium]
EQRVAGMYTDPTRLRSTDPGHVEGNPVFMYLDVFNPDTAEVEELKDRYRAGRVGDVEVKQRLARVLNDFMEPMRQRRRHYEQRMDEVEEALQEGTRRAKEVASATMDEVRSAMRIDSYTRRVPAGEPSEQASLSREEALARLAAAKLEPYWNVDEAGGPVLFRAARGAKGRPPEEKDRTWRSELIEALELMSEANVAAVRREVRRRVARSP